jgi:hypothetical protein
MKLKEMKPEIRYRVVKGTKRGALRTGDRIWIDKTKAGCILMCQDAGWIDDWSRLKADVSIDIEYYNKKIYKAKEDITYWKGIVGHSDDGIDRIERERDRQIKEEGWTSDHDDEHEDGELALVAALYATPIRLVDKKMDDPWPEYWLKKYDKRPRDLDGNILETIDMKRYDRIRTLEKAGALIAAEIDRIMRS